MISQTDSTSEQLAADIADIGLITSNAGLQIYRRNLSATATRALEISFPTFAVLLGKEGLKVAATKFLSDHPLQSGDWGEWGETLPEWILQQDALLHLPYLADIAKLDWICHIAERSAKPYKDRESITLLASMDAYELYLQTTASLAVMTSNFPTLEIWQAHHAAEINKAKWLALANQPLADGTQQYILIVCEKWRAIPRTISASEYAFMLALLKGQSVGDALDAVQDNNDYSTPLWLLEALKQCAVIGITHIPKLIDGGVL
ncbi:MAG: putative DNA-binding domain-containing protein [Methylotenera sp.]